MERTIDLYSCWGAEPVTTWVEAAAILGISVRTLQRRRAQHEHCRSEHPHPWFASADEVIQWYRRLIETKEERGERDRREHPGVGTTKQEMELASHHRAGGAS